MGKFFPFNCSSYNLCFITTPWTAFVSMTPPLGVIVSATTKTCPCVFFPEIHKRRFFKWKVGRLHQTEKSACLATLCVSAPVSVSDYLQYSGKVICNCVRRHHITKNIQNHPNTKPSLRNSKKQESISVKELDCFLKLRVAERLVCCVSNFMAAQPGCNMG